MVYKVLRVIFGGTRMKFQLIAPFKTHLNVLYFNALKDYQKYVELWDDVANFYKNDKNIEFFHVSNDGLIFEHIEEDGNNFSPEIICLKKDPVMREVMEETYNVLDMDSYDYDVSFDMKLEETKCCLYDNAVGVLETTIQVNDSFFQDTEEKRKQLLANIQGFTNTYMKTVLPKYYDKSIKKLIKAIHHLDKDNFLQKAMTDNVLLNTHTKKIKQMTVDKENIAEPLWVNRTLILPKLTEQSFFFNHWLSLGEDDVEQVAKQLEKDGFYFGWGNNLIIENEYDDKVLSSALDAVHLCQYYNVVYDYTNKQLSNIVGQIYATNGKGKTIKKVERLLEVNIENANLLFMQLNEQALNLQGHRQKYFIDLLSKWRIYTIKENIKKKISFGKEKLDYFYRKRSNFSNHISEAILFGIGGIALVDFFANVSLFSRTLKANPEMGKVDDNEFGIISIGKIISPDNMVWSGLLILLFLLFVFIFVRRRGRY